MKLNVSILALAFVGLVGGVALSGCATTSQDPYAANHTAPTGDSATGTSRMPSSADQPCEDVTPRCQLGDSYAGGRSPASEGGACKETVYECEHVSSSCKNADGKADTADSFEYAAHTRDCK